MILVDTSVWIDYLNGTLNHYTDTLDNFLSEENVVMGDLILLEILQGIKDDNHYQITKQSLSKLVLHELFGKEMAEICAENYRSLRKQGITIRKTADVIIASYCIHHSISLLFSDRDFVPFVNHLGLVPAVPLEHRL